MTTQIGAGVTLEGIGLDNGLTMNLAAGIVAADEGKPMTVDPSGNSKAKLCGDGDPIFGALFRVENRVAEGVLLGTVITEGGIRFNILTSDPIAVGDIAIGATGATVRKLVAGDNVDSIKPIFSNVVVEVDATTTPHTAVLWFD